MPLSEQKVWRFPGDSREDRAKRVALSYRHLCEEAAAGRVEDMGESLHRLDWAWRDYGVNWHVPSPAPLDIEEWKDATEMAHFADCTPRNIRDWHYRGHITSRTAVDGTPVYNVGEVIQYMARQRKARIAS